LIYLKLICVLSPFFDLRKLLESFATFSQIEECLGDMFEMNFSLQEISIQILLDFSLFAQRLTKEMSKEEQRKEQQTGLYHGYLQDRNSMLSYARK
jgi:hypothetical protein